MERLRQLRLAALPEWQAGAHLADRVRLRRVWRPIARTAEVETRGTPEWQCPASRVRSDQVPWYKKPGYTFVALSDVRRLTGLEPAELLLLTNTQQLTRVDENGAREELVRLPIELLLEQTED